MKKILTDEELVELAKQAKPVPVSNEFQIRENSSNQLYNSISTFMNETGLKPGKNPVEVSVIHDAYNRWSTRPTNLQNFDKQFSKYIRKQDLGFYKLNMQPITLLETIKEVNNEKNKKKQE